MRRDPAATFWIGLLAVGVAVVGIALGVLVVHDSVEHPSDTWRWIGIGVLALGILLALAAVVGLGHLWWESHREPVSLPVIKRQEHIKALMEQSAEVDEAARRIAIKAL